LVDGAQSVRQNLKIVPQLPRSYKNKGIVSASDKRRLGEQKNDTNEHFGTKDIVVNNAVLKPDVKEDHVKEANRISGIKAAVTALWPDKGLERQNNEKVTSPFGTMSKDKRDKSSPKMQTRSAHLLTQ
jgi:hypothetical protein